MSGPWQLPADMSLQWFTAHIPYKDKHTHTEVQKTEVAKPVTKGKKVWKTEMT